MHFSSPLYALAYVCARSVKSKLVSSQWLWCLMITKRQFFKSLMPREREGREFFFRSLGIFFLQTNKITTLVYAHTTTVMQLMWRYSVYPSWFYVFAAAIVGHVVHQRASPLKYDLIAELPLPNHDVENSCARKIFDGSHTQKILKGYHRQYISSLLARTYAPNFAPCQIGTKDVSQCTKSRKVFFLEISKKKSILSPKSCVRAKRGEGEFQSLPYSSRTDVCH